MGWIFEGIVDWISSTVTDLMDAVSGMFLNALGTDMFVMESYFPFVAKAFTVMQYIAWTILFLITVWQLFRSFGGPITEAENPWSLILRSCLFAVLIWFAKPIFLYVLEIARAPYTALMDLSNGTETFTFSGVENVIKNGVTNFVSTVSVVGEILVLILMISLGWNYFKLLLEVVERYVVVGVLCYTSPLAYSMGASKATGQVFKSWCRMVGSQLLLLVMNVWFLRAFNSSVGYYVANGGVLANGKGSEYEAHKDYFAEVDGKRIAKTSNGLYTQPCLTSEGAYQYILNSALAKIASDRKANIISISENDGGTYCHCDVCEDSYAQYGVSGTFFRFINRIAGDIAKVYPDVWVDTLSYDMSKEVPENLKLADNVIVRVCPRMCNFCTNPNKCENLAQDQQRVRDFVAICDNVYIWMYPINWGNLYAAMPNYDEMRYQVNFFAQAGVKGIYAEGYSKENPEFGELKAYLMAKLLQNPTMSKAEYEYHYNDFLQGYYGDAAKYIAQYHQITEDMMDTKMETAHYDKYFTAADNFDFAWDSATQTYDMTNINKINALWTAALNSVEEGSAEWHHIKKSMIHWTYIELYNTMDNRYKYGTTEEKAELVARNEALYNDIIYYGTIRIYDNSHDLQEITDFTKSPHKDKGNWFDQRTTLEETLGGLLGGLV